MLIAVMTRCTQFPEPALHQEASLCGVPIFPTTLDLSPSTFCRPPLTQPQALQPRWAGPAAAQFCDTLPLDSMKKEKIESMIMIWTIVLCIRMDTCMAVWRNGEL